MTNNTENNVNKSRYTIFDKFIITFSGIGAIFTLIMVILYFIKKDGIVNVVGNIFGFTGIILLGISWFMLKIKDAIKNRKKYETIENEIVEIQNNINQNENDFFPDIVKMNFKHLDLYYGQTRDQAKTSFYLACAVIIFGFILIVSSLKFGKELSLSLILGISGVISEFIGLRVLGFYHATIDKMSVYHQKLLIVQNISVALRTAEKIEDKELKKESLKLLIDRLSIDINKYIAEK